MLTKKSLRLTLVLLAVVAFDAHAVLAQTMARSTVRPVKCSDEEAPNGNPAWCVCPEGYTYTWRNPSGCHPTVIRPDPLVIEAPPARSRYAEPTACSEAEAPNGSPVHCRCPKGYHYRTSGGGQCIDYTVKEERPAAREKIEETLSPKQAIDTPSTSDSPKGTSGDGTQDVH